MRSTIRLAKPTVVVSKCLCETRCRWDGAKLTCPFVRALRAYARVIPVCPELEIGLGVPRDRIILVRESHNVSLCQPSANRRLARKMNSFSRDFLASHPDIDGFILKHKSPSCGLRGVKLYDSARLDAGFVRRGTGLFGGQVRQRFPHAAIEDEDRLGDHRIRDHWLTRLFTLAAFRSVRKSHSLSRLRSFHSHYRSLLTAYHRTGSRSLDRIVLRADSVTRCAEIEQYEATLHRILSRPARRLSMIGPFASALEHYLPLVGVEEKRRFKRQLRQYRAGQIPLADLRKIVQVWAVRYDKTFTRQQAVFRPYPNALADS